MYTVSYCKVNIFIGGKERYSGTRYIDYIIMYYYIRNTVINYSTL